MPARMIRSFLKLEAAGGILLIFAAILALILDNSPLDTYYNELLSVKFSLHLGEFGLSKPILLWINDGLMAIFFFLVGLELKREIAEGQLATLSNAILPIVAAIGGMVVPALLYIAWNSGDTSAMQGWAIPVATDIAFALGVLSLLGSRVPVGLKVFLTALAIIDDIGAIIIIAVFHSGDLSMISLALAGGVMILLFIFNRMRMRLVSVYVTLGIILWVCVLKSGVHATLAGVFLAFMIPMDGKNKENMLSNMEKKLHPWVAYFVMPVFAFANAGISFSGLSLSIVWHPIPLGIIIGLFFGKQFGVFLFTWVTVKLKFAHLPPYSNWVHVYGVSLLCGIGFTMSLFIGTLAFNGMAPEYLVEVRLGVLLASLLSGLAGYFVLHSCAKNRRFSHLTS